MNNKSYITHFILSMSLYLSLHLAFSTSSDPYFNTCFPAKCGDVNISYPLYITDQQHSYCGYPGFEVSCKSGSTPYLDISGSSYVIRSIWYENQTLEVVNSVFYSSADQSDCSGLIQNLTLTKGQFRFATNNSDLILLLKCPQKVLYEYKQDVVNCKALAAEENDPKLLALRSQCGGEVSVPYQGVRESSSLREVLERGVLLSWVSTNCSACTATGGQCGYSKTLSMFRCYCSDRPHFHQCHNNRSSKSTIIRSVTAVLAVGIFLLVILLIFLRKRHSVDKLMYLWTKGKLGNQSVEAFLQSYGSLVPKRYTYTDIKKMTNSFKNILGEGGYGHVYKGELTDGCSVAVKVLKNLKGNGEEFINEVLSISRTNHVNVVTLLGFCIEREKRALVYEFLPNGSLEKYIHTANGGQQLPCETLSNIAVSIARGLDYLHRGCNTRILHFDIKPHNILLDENFCPKISDFGLARLFAKEQSHISTLEARGTIGYIAPEVFCRTFGGVSHKSDVYSFGMMVLDMVCGRTDISAGVQHSSDICFFPEWIYNQLEDDKDVSSQVIMDDEEKKLRKKMILVGLWCTQTYPSNRPSMNTVIEMLEADLESLQMPPKPDLSSPSTSEIYSFSTFQSTT